MIEEADLDMTGMAERVGELGGSFQGMNVNPADFEGLLVRFSLEPYQNQSKSRDAGRPIFEEIPFVDIRTPGDRTSHIFRPAVDIDKAKWPKHWAAFEQKRAMPSEGTPLSQWPAMSRSMVEELKYFHIRTVEQLADLNDNAAIGFMGMQSWKERAKAFLEVSKDSAAAEHLAHELATRDGEINLLKEQLAALVERLNAEDGQTEED